MKIISIALVAGTAVAFAPSHRVNTNNNGGILAAEKVDDRPFANALGAQAPLGLWDPLGIIADGDQKTFDHFREQEIKHGRISMLAIAGYLTTAAGLRFPNMPADIPDGLAAFPALLQTDDGKNVLLQMTAFFAVAEIINREAEWVEGGAKPEFPGDYRNGSLDFGWDSFTEEEKLQKRRIELSNGRAAMMGIWGLIIHEQLGVSILPGGYLPGHP
eukprot:CAMPEP_0194161722 /NCGR_PEP_ID=MMETSP0152-20130528/79094_1 /TAXON_ID=1049557 /ORGANISM="Thalassiothrix antarctica, Strain L6-D1" /LENGTH=215 /DNA_ID=CAMNT_0038871537 /DNA_START=453 /DNA_END=1100 /DNA_ORIENTATION=+